MNEATIELVNSIKQIRKEKGLSQVELAKRCNVPQSTIGRIENLSMNPSVDIVCKILNVLNMKIELTEKARIRKGYDVFGKEYGIMLRNDTHDVLSVEHKLMQEQIRLDSVSEPFLYGGYNIVYPMEKHELYLFSKGFEKADSHETLKEVVGYTSKMASEFDAPLDEMHFGGTEKEILDRGTDWCFDTARLAAVILDCLGMTSRFVFVANPNKAYHGHVLLETRYKDSWGVVDPLYGYVFFDDKPVPAKEMLLSKQLREMEKDYQEMFQQIAIAEYNPNDEDNRYIVSKCNDYTLRLNTIEQDGTWKLNENL